MLTSKNIFGIVITLRMIAVSVREAHYFIKLIIVIMKLYKKNDYDIPIDYCLGVSILLDIDICHVLFKCHHIPLL